ncbi:hypothetical protein SAMN04488513_101606 [Pseudozobellia thermophila]|uniref:Uncharacterized protein n=2 Tax=Pseudozobellia thermophila TaxID=192903 RepID=A0A1M6C1I8_9FLAO|nr:hypothetical protein SAMN04488513_101606 [Pseudozobellia thermophila]
MGFWLLLPIVLISNTRTSDNRLLDDPFVEDGSYVVKAKEISDLTISGKAVFKKSALLKGQKKKFSRIEINLGPSKNGIQHTMGLVLFKQADGSNNPVGHYNVSQKTLGFSPVGEGVFGFADVGTLGELPFYTEHGTVYVSKEENGLLSGTLNLVMRNFRGKAIKITGSFRARNEN